MRDRKRRLNHGRAVLLQPACLLLLGHALAPATVAQDAHYWTEQYGNRARLLSGAVIGSATDVSAVYYNPGALAFLERAELLLAGTAVELTRYDLDAPGDVLTGLDQTSFGGAAPFFAGEIRFPFLGETRFAYSVLTRFRADIRLEDAAVADEAFLETLGLLDASVVGSFEEKLSETWAGLTLARVLSERVAVGISPYVSVRSQRFVTARSTRLLDSLEQATISDIGANNRYYDWDLLAKLGLAVELVPWRLGFSFTTPKLHLFGSGTALGTLTRVRPDTTDVVVSLLEEGAPAHYQIPWSIGGGASYEWNRTIFQLSAEFFAGVAEREAIEFESQEDEGNEAEADSLLLGITEELAPVLNVAAGVQRRFSEAVEGYVGFRTDFSARKPESTTDFPIAGWDIYHLSSGANVNIGRTNVTLGLGLGWGSESDPRFVPSLDRQLLGLEDAPGATIRFLRLTGVLGFSIEFGGGGSEEEP